MEAYSRLAKLPSPRLEQTALLPLIQRVVHLEQRLRVEFHPGPNVASATDPDQLEQLLINLLRNAVDAVLEIKSVHQTATSKISSAEVKVTWTVSNGQVEISIEDDCPGIANPANLFIPFFTTKPGGSGIGLVLSRPIAKAHGGALVLDNRRERSGCIALLRLPVHPSNGS